MKLKLEYLICSSKTFGVIRKLHPKLGGSTTLDTRLNCQVHICKDYAAFRTMNADLVKRMGSTFWTAFQVRNLETGECTDPPEDGLFAIEPLSAAEAMVGAAKKNTPTAQVSRPSPEPVGIVKPLPPLPDATTPPAKKRGRPANPK
jgi:hypothetical protein